MVCFSHASMAFFYASLVIIARQSYPISCLLFSLTGLSDGVPKKVAEVSVI